MFDVTDGAVTARSTPEHGRKRVFLQQARSVGVYDWIAHVARWTGRRQGRAQRAPVPLQDGDMSGLLINLAVIRDAAPGATLHYRFVDDGRARDHALRRGAADRNHQPSAT